MFLFSLFAVTMTIMLRFPVNATKGLRLESVTGVLSAIAFYEKVIKVKADVAAFLINCFPSA